MGTNPLAFGFPTEGDPLLVDVGMSSLMYTDLALRVRRGEPLAQGLALDEGGKPTQDPRSRPAWRTAVLRRAQGLCPGAGHAGARHPRGIGGGSRQRGYVVMAMQPDLLVPLAEYRRALSESLAR